MKDKQNTQLLIKGFLINLIILTILASSSSGVKWCDTNSRESETEIKDNPIVNVSIPSVEAVSLFTNDSFIVLANNDVQIALFCSAPYPIEWIEIYGKDSDGFETDNTTLWNEKVSTQEIDTFGLEEFEQSDNWYYQSSFVLSFRGKMCSGSTYTCQSVENPCFQTNAFTTIDKMRDTVTIKITDEPELVLIQNVTIENNTACPAILTYTYSSIFPKLQCKTASGVPITETSEYYTCDSAAHCNIFLQHHRGGLNCVIHKEECFYCGAVKNPTYKPAFVTCKDNEHGLLLAIHYFFSVPQVEDEKPLLYFKWEDADPNLMLSLEPIPIELYLNDSITVFCKISRYYFAYGHRFALEFENNTIQFLNATDGEVLGYYNVNRINTTVNLNDVNLKRIYCLAPIWNNTEWVNKSVTIEIRTDPLKASFTNFSTLYKQEHEIHETVTFYAGDVNKSITCSGYGKPKPEVYLLETVPGAHYIVTETSETSIQIEFPHVKHKIEGKYICVAENYLGSQMKVFQVVVRDRFLIIITTASLIILITMISCFTTLYLCWRKIKEQRKELRLLTESELKEFLDGNIDAVRANDYLDTSDLIQSLPYNNKYEIPREMIHIDRSMVLGSGNFGQVFKGHIQVLNNQDGRRIKNELKRQWSSMCSIEVAVKTVKHDMEIMYFKTLLSEVKIMAYIGKHSNIVSLVGACTQNIRKREIFIAVEYCDHGSMEAFLRKYRKSFINLVKDDVILVEPNLQRFYENLDHKEDLPVSLISTHHLVKWAREIANGMDYLGSKKIIHGDLALRNVFLSKDLIAKIGDFGLSKQLLEHSTYVKNQEGFSLPWKWTAYESLQYMKFSVYSDAWSYGILLWEVFTLANSPYPGVNNWSPEFLDQLYNGMRMHKPSYATTKIYNIMLDCWNLEPTSRPSFLMIKREFESIILSSGNSEKSEYFDPELFQKNKNSENVVPSTSTSESSNQPIYHNKSYSMQNPEIKLTSFNSIEDTQGYLVPFFQEHEQA